MFINLRKRAGDESGFTLIELLVVILIIGILAAIALPAFLGQRTKGQDSAAQSNARNLVSQLESHYTDGNTYTGFAQAGTGIPTSEATATPNDAGDGYAITATSKSKNTFTITKGSDGTSSRTCAVPAGGNKGGCNASWITATTTTP